MVNIFNNVTPSMWEHSERSKKAKPKGTVPAELQNDADGSKTLAFLERINWVGRLVLSNDYAGSLGLDQAVYSYGATGKLHHAAFLASFKFALEIHETERTYQFTTVRASFEDFLVKHKSFLNDLSHWRGSRLRSLESIMLLHRTVLNCLLDGISSDRDIVNKLLENPDLKGLNAPQNEEEDAADKPSSKFSKTAQAIGIVRDLLATRSRCEICGARLPPYARSKDHVVRAEDGGSGHSDNLRFTHPYCNSGYKEAKHHAKEQAKRTAKH